MSHSDVPPLGNNVLIRLVSLEFNGAKRSIVYDCLIERTGPQRKRPRRRPRFPFRRTATDDGKYIRGYQLDEFSTTRSRGPCTLCTVFASTWFMCRGGLTQGAVNQVVPRAPIRMHALITIFGPFQFII